MVIPLVNPPHVYVYFVVGKMGDALIWAGKKMAPAAKEQAERVLPDSYTSPGEEGRSTFDKHLEAGAEGMKGTVTTFNSLP